MFHWDPSPNIFPLLSHIFQNVKLFNTSFCFVWKSRVKKFLHRLCKEGWTTHCWHAQFGPKSFHNSTLHPCEKRFQTITEMCSCTLPFSPLGWPCREEAFPMMILNIQSHQGGTAEHRASLSPQEPLSFPGSLLYPFCFLYPQEARCF